MGTRDVFQLVGRLLSIHKALAWIPSTTQTGHGGVGLGSSTWEVEIRISQGLPQVNSEFKDSLYYMRPHF